MTASWHFNTMRPCDKSREPIQGEFFAVEAIDRPGEALVREGIQNSLDARHDDAKVMVRIHVSGTEGAVDRAAIAPFINGLDEHIRAPGNGLREIPAYGDNCPFLIFEDFGTTGLTGDPAEWKTAAGSRNNFHDFFRAEGRSDKSEKDIGRWGVGKQVFPRASRINSIFGLTVRADDKKKMLMGMAVLKSHDVNATRYAPDGWLGCQGDDEMVLPIEETPFIDSFVGIFDIQRGDDPGLTVVVPWYDLDLTDENLVRAVLSGYFWPILKGRLEVWIETGSIKTILDSNSMENEIRKIGNDLEREILPLVDLAKWTASLADSDYIKLEIPEESPTWQWSQDLFPRESLPGLRERYERGEKIAIRVSVPIREKNKEERSTHFDVFFVRDGSDYKGRPVYIRKGIIIPDVRRRGSGVLRGVRSLVIAEHGPIAAFLGDAENPAHTQWQKDGANFKGKYENGPKILEFVTHSVIDIVRIITEQDRKEDRTLLAHLFSIPAPPEQPRSRTRVKKKPEKKQGPEPDIVPPLPPPRPRSFVIDRIDGGFVVRSADADGAPAPGALSIRAAYQVRRGNAFKKYHPADFDFSQRMETQLTGAAVLEKKQNTLRVKLDSKEFRIEVSGFDPRRDVRVEVRPEEETNAGSDA